MFLNLALQILQGADIVSEQNSAVLIECSMHECFMDGFKADFS